MTPHSAEKLAREDGRAAAHAIIEAEPWSDEFLDPESWSEVARVDLTKRLDRVGENPEARVAYLEQIKCVAVAVATAIKHKSK